MLIGASITDGESETAKLRAGKRSSEQSPRPKPTREWQSIKTAMLGGGMLNDQCHKKTANRDAEANSQTIPRFVRCGMTNKCYIHWIPIAGRPVSPLAAVWPFSVG